MNNIPKNGTSKSITINDIAEALSVSKTTISRAISGKGRVSEGTRSKVLEYIKEHDYRPNQIAKSLAHSKTYNIGVVIPSDPYLVGIPFFQNCLMGICEVVASLDYDVVVTTVTESDISLLKRIIDNQKVDGVLLTRTLINDLPAKYLKEKRIPFVVIGTCEDKDIIQIDSDTVSGCCELTTYLLMSGLRSMALLAGNQSHMVDRNRYEGFLKAHKEQDVTINNDSIFLNMTNKAVMDRAVDSAMENKVDCIVCSDDIICSKVLARLTENNYSVPQDVRIASLYNSTFLESHNPPITALNIDVKELGISAGSLLVEMLSGKEVASNTLFNYDIVIRKSTK